MAFENYCGGPDSLSSKIPTTRLRYFLLPQPIQSVLEVMGNDDDSIGDNDSEVGALEYQLNVEDGRTVVASRQSRGRRN
ncbi:unnamed protein product [Camellia sinensis]